MIRIESIWIAPIAGLPMVRVKEASLTERGLTGDREFSLMSIKTGKRYISSDSGKSNLITDFSVSLNREASLANITHLPTGSILELSLHNAKEDSRVKVDLFDDTIEATVWDIETAWFQSVLQDTDVQFVQKHQTLRIIHRPRYSMLTDVGFHHGCPISIHSKESEVLLECHSDCTLSPNIFRSNIILEGFQVPHGEDYLYPYFFLGETKFFLIELIGRCGTINIPSQGYEPINMLSHLQYRKHLYRGKSVPFFGIYCYTPDWQDCNLKVGMELTFAR